MATHRFWVSGVRHYASKKRSRNLGPALDSRRQLGIDEIFAPNSVPAILSLPDA